ncbi:TonB-dependent receptor [Zophobihabitans entericus]|uniref:Uncharacterized protein n=1 Tax=Zophobihabitans entericus TaxID=1635327 RepID=A0A6G9IEH4_9GAMM|nr:hypothetical protein [Zophobihabitans entericus]QIQ22227.1 hypothetical protein IPMB12_11320 [Zophobihabitans entericus]
MKTLFKNKMKTRMKLLDYTLLSILAGFTVSASAQETVNDEALFKVRPKSEMTNQELGPIAGEAKGGGKFAITLPNGGMVWASEDSNVGQAELSISAPSYIAFSNGRITKPIQFYVRSNYSAFVDHYELSIYRGKDTDLVEPIVVLPLEVKSVSSLDWNGELPSKYNFRVDDELIYVLRAYNSSGNFDETYAKTIKLVTPEEDERGNVALSDTASRIKGQSMTKEEALAESLINDVIGSNNLYQQNIPIYGSRVRIQGNRIPEGSLLINGESYPVDLDRKFSASFLLPVGEHRFDIEVQNKNGDPVEKTLDVNVTGSSFFLVGLADVTMYQNKASGKGETLATQGDKDLLTDGRLAFYMKTKIDGKYTVTAQADTTEREIEHLFSGFGKAYPDDLFRSLDPDMYYPTYGDDSNVYRDVDTQGRFYARVDWDKSQALWGNYNTGISGTEYGRYTRSLYGAALNWRSQDNNKWGEAKTQLRAFGSEAQSAPGHTEFLGTGGSLYYLKHANILSGSDKVQLEVRDKLTGRTEAIVSLVRGVDYEIDATQGRIILTKPLTQLTLDNLPSITHDRPINGYEQRLIADYEYIPSGFETDSITVGARGKQWIGDHIGVGVTYVDENQSGNDYTMKGADVTLKAGNGTYLKAEYTKTESTGVPIFFSDNGGLSFAKLNTDNTDRSGNAKAIDGRVNFQELGVVDFNLNAGAWWHKVSDGYSTSSSDTGQEITEYGAEASAEPIDGLSFYTRHTKAERGESSYTQTQLTSEYRLTDVTTVTGEVRRVQTKTASEDATGTLGAVRYSWKMTPALELYGTGQLTLSNDGGNYENNDAVTAGFKYLYGDLSSIGLEGTTGSRGYGALLSAEHRISSDHTVYGNYSLANTRSDYDSVFNSNQNRGWTVGQRWRLTDRLNMFNETQNLKDTDGSTGVANTVGMDYLFDGGWSSSITVQDGKLDSVNGGTIHRSAVSVSASRTTEDMDWSTKIELRRDVGAEHRRQWVTTNRLSMKLDESWRISARLNLSETKDYESRYDGARFVESGLGFAWRPVDSDKWALFGRYSYIYNMSSSEQENNADYYDQRSHIFSLEGVHKYNADWEFAAKLAQREGEVRFGRNSGQWFDSQTTFGAVQARYDLIDQWHVMGEYRVLKVKDDGVKQGWLVGVDRDITSNLRIGIGYNFTDFSDDLSKFDYKYKGFFINMVGYY